MNGREFDVRFSIKRSTFVFMHESVELVAEGKADLRTVMPSLGLLLGKAILDVPSGVAPHPPLPRAPIQSWCNGSLDDQQRRAVERILEGRYSPRPFMVFGPPGTGKTR